MAVNNVKERLAELSKVLAGVKNIYLLSHDNPDPDSLASMIGLRFLLAKHFRIHSKLLYGGVIGRAENRAMVRLLKIPIIPLERVKLHKRGWFALVDTQPSSKNNSLPEWARVLMVFDHHPLKKPVRSAFSHVCEDLGATSTLIFNYLEEAGLEINWHLATALAYALITETQDLGRETHREDIQTYLKVIPKARLRVLSNIKYPPLARDYYRTLGQALKNAYNYKNIVVIRLGAVESTDMIHQMADLFLRFERRSWSLCIGWNADYIQLSLRSSIARAKCGSMTQKLVRGKGSAGGHDMVAGGQIVCKGKSEEEKIKIEELIINRFLRILNHPKGLELLSPMLGEEEQLGGKNQA
ncbi:MAG TPA: DHH family phosphoesterase [archaeon]|nr:DHH family phosphoesterase [archaeon]